MSAPLEWIKTVSDTLQGTETIPLWGNPPPFPWEEASTKLRETLEMEDVKIFHQKTETLSDPFVGFGKNPHVIPFQLTPLSEKAYLIMSSSDVAAFLKASLASVKKPEKGFSDPKLQEGFYVFLAVSVMQALNSLNPFEDLSISLSEQELPSGEGLGIDILFGTFHARIFCPKAFHTEFSHHFASHPFSITTSPLAKEIEIDLRLKIGSTILSLQKWEEVQVGDFVLLEHASFDPEKNKGSVTINLNNTPLFHANYREGVIKILDYAFYYEEGMNMQENEDPMWEGDSEPKNEAPLEKAISMHETPVVLTVEMGRMQMKLEKLLQLQPGNVLELSMRPELGLNITVNGTKVAKGELIKMGDAYGLKILSIG